MSSSKFTAESALNMKSDSPPFSLASNFFLVISRCFLTRAYASDMDSWYTYSTSRTFAGGGAAALFLPKSFARPLGSGGGGGGGAGGSFFQNARMVTERVVDGPEARLARALASAARCAPSAWPAEREACADIVDARARRIQATRCWQRETRSREEWRRACRRRRFFSARFGPDVSRFRNTRNS
jgi:hypothetical protein